MMDGIVTSSWSEGAVTRVLAIDDHGLVSSALTNELRSRGYDARACEVLDDEAILSIAKHFQPSVVLLDLVLGRERSSISLIRPLQKTGAKVVILTAATDPVRLAECLEAGADGLVSKSVRMDDLVRAIEGAAEEDCAPRSSERRELLARLEKHRERQRVALSPFASLTNREQEVLAALVDGKTAQTVAELSFTSIRTVRGHIQAILDKLDVNSQLSAVAKARNARWGPESSRPPQS